MNDILKNSLNRHYHKQETAAEYEYVPPTDVIDPFNGKWKAYIPAAKAQWGLIGENELIRCEGRRSNLTWLLQSRYTMSSADANKQIDNFLQQCDL